MTTERTPQTGVWVPHPWRDLVLPSFLIGIEFAVIVGFLAGWLR